MKVAVLINGSGKHLDLLEGLYNEYNKLYSDVDFDFYVATWEDDIDYSNFKWITKYIRLKEEDCPYDLANHPKRRHQPHYCFTLLKAYELIQGEYDAILQTRSDFYLFRELLDQLIAFYKDKQVTKDIIYSFVGSSAHNGYLWTDDLFFYGHQQVFKKYSQIFEDLFIKKIFDESKVMMHVMQAEYFNYQKIYNRSSFPATYHGLLIREPMRFEPLGAHTDAGWHKKHPSPSQFKFLLEEHGPNWLLQKGNALKAREFFEFTCKE